MNPHVVNAALALPKIHIAQWSSLRHVLPVGVVGIISWSVWLFRFTLSRIYRPQPPGDTSTTSVVVPSFREDPDILSRCLDSWLPGEPTENNGVPHPVGVEVIPARR